LDWVARFHPHNDTQEAAFMALLGKGFWIWQVLNTEGGNPETIANMAQEANLTHVPIKIADGTMPYNIDRKTGVDYALPVVQALNIQVWGWHYVYGDDPAGEANIAIQRIQQLGLDGYIIDAEVEYKAPGKDAAARAYMTALRRALLNLPIALSAFRFPTYHPEFPWKDFLEKCDLNMPQVYWEQAHNPAYQLTRCLREFQAINPFRPVIPVGPTYKEGGWMPTDIEILEFLNTARSLNLAAANFFSWQECRKYMDNIWYTIRSYSWSVQPPPLDMPERVIAAMNTHDANQVAALYAPNAIYITSSRTLQGSAAIRQEYDNLLRNILPNATFTLVSSSGTGSSRHFAWRAVTPQGTIRDGSDTIGLIDNKISYHYSHLSAPHT
jgi:hypothetical protein